MRWGRGEGKGRGEVKMEEEAKGRGELCDGKRKKAAQAIFV
jgi:hypothetical protein